MKKRIGKGQLLTELVKGSLNYTMERLRTAFRAQFRSEDRYWNWYIVEVFADHVIVMDDDLPPDEFYRVSYQRSGEGYVFASRDAWEVVELTYQSRTANERRRMHQGQVGRGKSGAGQIVERVAATWELGERVEGKARRITARGMTADIINNNQRRYPADVLQAAVDEAQAGMGSGSLQLLGEVDHPSDKPGAGHASALETVVRWDSIGFAESEVTLSGTIIETTKGRDLIALLDSGVRPRLSQRAYGFAETVKEGGRTFSEIKELHITGYDLVMDPGDPTAAILTVESRTNIEETITMDLETLRKDYPELVAKIEAEHDARKRAQMEESLRQKADQDARNRQVIAESNAALRQSLGLSETDDLQAALDRQQAELKRLQEAEQARAVQAYVAEQVDALKYPDWLRNQLVESINAAAPTTVDLAKTVIVAKRKEYDGIMAQLELAARGFGNGVHVLGPVLERERGVPQFAQVSFALTESLAAAGRVERRDLRQPKTPSERFAAAYLESFDRRNRHHLVREAQAYSEAETTADLALPFSVSRAVMGEALPLLVAASVFDIQMVEQAPARIYYERFVGETGSTGTVVDEVVAASNPLGSFVALASKRIIPGTVVVTNSGATTTYTEGTDYVIDHTNGQFKALAGGTITAGQSLKIDYTYDAIRKGEMQSIERAKMQMVYKTMEIAADRLATQISREAIVFSRSQIGYDVVNRTMSRIIESIQRKIDRGMFQMALMASLQVANNSGGTWTAASDTLDDLVKKIGAARVKLTNRYYPATAVVLSATNGDRLANWSGFTQLGSRPDADLNAQGYVGRVKGIPVFETTEHPDSYIQVVNRELVMHRVYQTMELRGPFPTYSSDGELIAADQYYAEEFNGTDTTLDEKGSYVKIA